jgi:restriction endonuclease Mrr
VGIDITMLAVNLIRYRLKGQFAGKSIPIFVDGIPKDVSGAKSLFKKDPFEFEYWALDLVSAVPAQSKTKENMRGADKGIDGVINFVKDVVNGQMVYGKLLVQVKGGSVHRNDIATLKGDIEREKADGGLLITLEKPTKPMLEEAVEAGSYKVNFSKGEFPKIQIITVEELLMHREPKLPLQSLPYFKEAKAVKEALNSKTLGF